MNSSKIELPDTCISLANMLVGIVLEYWSERFHNEEATRVEFFIEPLEVELYLRLIRIVPSVTA